MRKDAQTIIQTAIAAVLPDEAVRRALEGVAFPGRVILVAVGKAAWQMAKAAQGVLGSAIDAGVVVTKYGHVQGKLAGIACCEAGHPVPDENSFCATQAVLDVTAGLSASDTVLFLLSGGGSALFEKPLLPAQELFAITNRLLASGASITEINTIRKRLSAVKGGRFGLHCAPARVFSIVLSDIVGDPLSMIASGPACADESTCAQALAIAEKYALTLSPQARTLLREETPKALANVESCVVGSVKALCAAAADACKALGYAPTVLTDALSCEARDAGAWLGRLAAQQAGNGKKIALIAGGETVVRLTGHGKGGRNQELALAAAKEIARHSDVLVFSVGSDGTDGPTDAAGGMVDGQTMAKLQALGIAIDTVLRENDAYHALAKADGLIFTGPTGTNVNDVAVALIGK